MSKNLILASASPRRSEILNMAGYEFHVIPSAAEEISQGFSPEEAARLNALAKAREVYSRCGENNVVVGADTVVTINGEILGKPKDKEDAFKMLKSLSGKVHYVITGYAVISEKGENSGYCSTKVIFRPISDKEILDYIATAEPMDKAGAYAIQEKGSVFIESIEGDFFNVVGLPAEKLFSLLKNYEILPNWQKELSKNY